MEILEWKSDESAYRYALRVILHNIILLELKPGEEVSSAKLAAAMSVSRMPVRDALAELQRMDLVRVLPQRGTYVTKIDTQLVQEAGFMRAVLEAAVVKLACKGISPDIQGLLQENLDTYRAAQKKADSLRMLKLDNTFHRLLFESVDKSWVYEKLQSHMAHFDRLRMVSLSYYPEEKTSQTLKDHEDILHAVLRQDAETAETLVNRHLSHYFDEIPQMKEQHPDFFTT